MPLEPMQCPKCGSPLLVEPAAASAFCSYCGSRLRVARGASGHPVGLLDRIETNSAILARQTAINRLQECLPALYAQRDALKEEADKLAAGRRPRATGRAVLGLLLTVVPGLVALILLPLIAYSLVSGSAEDRRGATSAAECFLTPCLALAVAGAVIWRRAAGGPRRSQAEASSARFRLLKLNPAIAAVEEEIRSTQARIDQLKVEMDRLARGL